MISNSAVLGIGDAEIIARWFLYRVKPEQRRQLMADLPQVYSRMYPDVDQAIITAAVARGMAQSPRTDPVIYGDYCAEKAGTWRVNRGSEGVLNLPGDTSREVVASVLTALQSAYDGS